MHYLCFHFSFLSKYIIPRRFCPSYVMHPWCFAILLSVHERAIQMQCSLTLMRSKLNLQDLVVLGYFCFFAYVAGFFDMCNWSADTSLHRKPHSFVHSCRSIFRVAWLNCNLRQFVVHLDPVTTHCWKRKSLNYIYSKVIDKNSYYGGLIYIACSFQVSMTHPL